MEIINTIQKRNKLNTVYRTGDIGHGGAYHDYIIVSDGFDYEELAICNVNFHPVPPNGTICLFRTKNDAIRAKNLMEARGIITGDNICSCFVNKDDLPKGVDRG